MVWRGGVAGRSCASRRVAGEQGGGVHRGPLGVLGSEGEARCGLGAIGGGPRGLQHQILSKPSTGQLQSRVRS